MLEKAQRGKRETGRKRSEVKGERGIWVKRRKGRREREKKA